MRTTRVLGPGSTRPLLPALEGDEAAPETYGEGKVACEEACRAARGDDVLLARSGLIVGYGDRSDRLGYWPGRYRPRAGGRRSGARPGAH